MSNWVSMIIAYCFEIERYSFWSSKSTNRGRCIVYNYIEIHNIRSYNAKVMIFLRQIFCFSPNKNFNFMLFDFSTSVLTMNWIIQCILYICVSTFIMFDARLRIYRLTVIYHLYLRTAHSLAKVIDDYCRNLNDFGSLAIYL